MRVLSINDFGDPVGGAEIIWRRSNELLAAAGVDVRLFAADVVRARRTPLSYVANTAFCRATDRVVRGWRPDVVHLHNIYHLASPAVLGTLLRAKRRGDVRAVAMTPHDYHLLCPSPGLLEWDDEGPHPADPQRPIGPLDKVRRRWDPDGWARSELRAVQHLVAYDLARWQRAIDVALCPSRFQARALRRVVPTRVLPNPAPAYVAPPPRHDGLRVLYAGRLVPEKGIVPFLEMAPVELLDRLVVAGSGIEEPECRAVVRRRGAATTFLGQVPHAELLELIASCHVLVLPSRNPENAPTILFEALAHGASILGSDLGGIREIVEDSGVGHLFDPWDEVDVQRACTTVLEAHAAGKLDAVDAAEYLAQRSEANHVRELLAVYQEVAA